MYIKKRNTQKKGLQQTQPKNNENRDPLEKKHKHKHRFFNNVRRWNKVLKKYFTQNILIGKQIKFKIRVILHADWSKIFVKTITILIT